MLCNQNAETYLQAVQCDTMDKSRCVVVELVLGGFRPPSPIIVALYFDVIPHLRCKLMDCVTHRKHSLPDKISLIDMHLLEISHKIMHKLAKL